MSEFMGKMSALLTDSERCGHEHSSMPSPPEFITDFPLDVAASAQSAVDDGQASASLKRLFF